MIKNLTLSLAVCLFLFGTLEAVLRFSGFHGLNASFNPVEYSAELGWKLKPNYRASWEEFEWKVPYATSSKGFRDSEHEMARKPGILRALVIGDSFAEGYGVAFEDMWQARLAKKANLEVINLGVRGYDILQECRQFLSEGLPYKPDLVIQILNETDLHFAGGALLDTSLHLKPGFEIRDGKLLFQPAAPKENIETVGAWQKGFRAFIYNSAAAAWIRRQITLIRPADVWLRNFAGKKLGFRKMESTEVRNSHYMEDYGKAAALAAGDMARAAKENGFTWITVWMDAEPHNPDQKQIMDDLKQASEGTLEIKLGDSERFRYDRHPNEKGHARIAEEIAAFLELK